MRNITKIVCLMCLASLMTACSSKKESLEPEGIKYKAQEITVRQCLDIDDNTFINLLKEHDTSVKKQMSPHLYIVTWDDDRNAAEVVKELHDTAMFCGVDKYQEE